MPRWGSVSLSLALLPGPGDLLSGKPFRQRSLTRAVSAIGLDLRKVSWPDAYLWLADIKAFEPGEQADFSVKCSRLSRRKNRRLNRRSQRSERLSFPVHLPTHDKSELLGPCSRISFSKPHRGDAGGWQPVGSRCRLPFLDKPKTLLTNVSCAWLSKC
jgi:hypothetical protein